jgi:hypothetical protein
MSAAGLASPIELRSRCDVKQHEVLTKARHLAGGWPLCDFETYFLSARVNSSTRLLDSSEIRTAPGLSGP